VQLDAAPNAGHFLVVLVDLELDCHVRQLCGSTRFRLRSSMSRLRNSTFMRHWFAVEARSLFHAISPADGRASRQFLCEFALGLGWPVEAQLATDMSQ